MIGILVKKICTVPRGTVFHGKSKRLALDGNKSGMVGHSATKGPLLAIISSYFSYITASLHYRITALIPIFDPS